MKKVNSSKDKVTIKIPRRLYDTINTIISDSGFDSATDFIVYILRDLVSLRKETQKEFSQKEINIIKKRLKDLGYL